MGQGEKKETNHKRLLKTENKQGCWREVGGGCAKCVMGIKEGTCYDEH